MNYLEFIAERKKQQINQSLITEAFNAKEVDKAHKLMLDLFKKKIDGTTLMDPSPIATKVDGKDCISITFINLKDKKTVNMLWNLNYLVSGKSAAVYSVDFFSGKKAEELLFGDGEAESDLSIFTMGYSVAYFLPLIFHVVNNKDFNLKNGKAEEIAKKVFESTESYIYYYGSQPYNIYENMNNETIETAFRVNQGQKLVNKVGGPVWESEAEEIKKAVRKAEVESWKTKGDSEEAKKASIQLDRDYREICKAIKGGATTKEDLEVALGRKITVQYDTDDSVTKATSTFKKQVKKGKEPEQAFKEMQAYVSTVIKGMQPGVILCGAPGIGKTYRVLKQLKARGYENGKNLQIIKGKCTPRQLYLMMYEHQLKGNILVIDDADALVGPKAPEDCINILKAALDSTADDEGRLVSYRVSGKLLDDEGNPIPKDFYYNGSIIVITNYSVGQLDTAVRGRVFTQTLDFTTEQLLGIIKGIMPDIDPTKLKAKAKMKAYDYLKELAEKGTDMEISVRSFGTCARLFQICEDDPDFSDDDARSMIEEQMTNAALKTGRKF